MHAKWILGIVAGLALLITALCFLEDSDLLDGVREGMTMGEVKSIPGIRMGEPAVQSSGSPVAEVLDLPEGARAEDVEVAFCVDQDRQAYLIWFYQGRVIRVQKTTVPER